MFPRIRIASGLALIAAVTLMVELLLMRVFDAILYTEMSYLIISCALFAFGLSGVYTSLRPLRAEGDIRKYIARLSVAFGVFCVLLLPLINWNPFDYNQITSTPMKELFWFGVLYLTLIVPFFLSGLIFTTVFNGYASEIRYLYCFDLCGAAIGCVAFIPFIPAIGPGGLLFAAGAFSLVAAFLFSDGKGLATKATLPLAAALAVAPFLHDGYFDFHTHGDKRGVGTAEADRSVEFVRWDPLAKIEVAPLYGVDPKTGKKYLRFKHVAYDGGSQSSHLYKFDGDLAKLRNEYEHDLNGVVTQFWNRSVFAAHRMRADHGSDVLIIGSAAGQETKAALMYNPKSVDAIEMVGAVVELAKNEYSPFIGNIFRDPRVHVQVGEGRTFLRGTSKKYDIIQIFSNHTSSAMAAGGGAGHGTYLHTVEAYMEYFSALKPDGMLQINSHIYPRMVATGAVAWKRLGHTDDFRKHVIVFERDGIDTIPLFLVKMTPWTPAEVASLSEFMFRPTNHPVEDKYHLSENPLDPKHSFLSDEFYSGTLSPELLAKVPYRVAPPTDDQPYFNFLRRHFYYLKPSRDTFTNESAAGWLNSSLGRVGLPKDVGQFFVVGAAGVFFGILFVLLPLTLAPVGRQRWKGEFTSLLYFSCLGAGFIIVELTYTQLFMKLIGYPLYTYSAVIFTMLAAAGLGSLAAGKLNIAPNTRWWIPFAGTVGLGVLMQWIQAPIADHFLAEPIMTRILVAALMIFPPSFFMGMCMPLGILAIKDKPKGAIPWAWGMNGLFTTMGGLGSAVLSMFWGFSFSLHVAFAIYVVAALSMWRLSKVADRSDAPADEVLDPRFEGTPEPATV